MIPTMTPEQQAQLAAVQGEFAGTDEAQIYGDSKYFYPGKGRVRLGATKMQGRHFIIEAEAIWFRGGTQRNEQDPTNPAKFTLIPDTAIVEGDAVAVFIDKTQNTKGGHFKSYGLAVMRAIAVRDGRDPATITDAMITQQIVGAIHVQQLQRGLSVDFDSVSISKKNSVGTFTKTTFVGDRADEPGPMRAPQAPTAQALGQTAIETARPQVVSQTNPLAVLGLGGPAQASPLAALGLMPQTQAPVDPLAALGLGAQTQAQTQAPVDPLAALTAQLAPAAPVAPSRDAKIAAIKTARPQLAGVDFSQVADAAVDAAFAALP